MPTHGGADLPLVGRVSTRHGPQVETKKAFNATAQKGKSEHAENKRFFETSGSADTPGGCATPYSFIFVLVVAFLCASALSTFSNPIWPKILAVNRPLIHLLIALALLWRGLLPAGVMAMPGENGFEVRLCGLNGGSVVLDLGLEADADAEMNMDEGSSACAVCASLGSVALPVAAAPMLPHARSVHASACFCSDVAPRGPPLRVTARGPPPFI